MVKFNYVLFISILSKGMGWYLGAIKIINNKECRIYIFEGEITDGTTNILSENHYNSWFQQQRGKF